MIRDARGNRLSPGNLVLVIQGPLCGKVCQVCRCIMAGGVTHVGNRDHAIKLPEDSVEVSHEVRGKTRYNAALSRWVLRIDSSDIPKGWAETERLDEIRAKVKQEKENETEKKHRG